MAERRMHKVTAIYGERQITVTLRFDTNGLTNEKGTIIPLHARDEGWATLDGNKSHGLKGQRRVRFHSLMEITTAVEKLLTDGGVKIHQTGRARKYIQE